MSAPHTIPLLRAPVFAAACLLLAASCAPMSSAQGFFADLPSHFPVYILLASPLLAAGVFILRQPALLMFPAMMAAGIAFVQVYPFLSLSPPPRPAAAANSFKLLQINVYTGNRDTAPFAALVETENPDIIVIAEVNSAFRKRGGMLAGSYPYQHYFHQTAVLSRLPLDRIEVAASEGVLSRPQFFRVSFSGRFFTLATFHAASPPAGLGRRNLEFAEFGALVRDMRRAGRIRDPFVFAGDINVTPYAAAMKKLAAELDVRNAREGMGLLHSWPVWLPAPLRIPIDHVLVSADMQVLDYRPGPPVGSDHLPTIAVLGLPAAP
jgi:endonuclease/exonuclease/phosphatase (EEP) superfamily protein YafD